MRAATGGECFSWWAALKHGGLLISPSKLAERFAEALPPLSQWAQERLRRALTRFDADERALSALLDTVLEEVLELGKPRQPETGHWLKGSNVSSDWAEEAATRELVKPQRVWQGPNGGTLPLFTDGAPRLGVGRGRRAPARVVEWLRKRGLPFALLTNGRQWRLIHASLDSDAFAEWDTSLWFEEGHAGPQVTALRALLCREALDPPRQGEPPPLHAAIEESKKGQAELSALLGERVRCAVELLIQETLKADELPRGFAPSAEGYRAIYLAATRIVMRMVVILFAEARDLLPRDNPIYQDSYSLEGLRESLERAAGGAGAERLCHRHGAWGRVLALFSLVYHGSPHQALCVTAYGGGLFEPGDEGSKDPVSRALALFEDPEPGPSDAVVCEILKLLCRSRVKVRQGRGATWIQAAVDFSDLSSEYIGILYEGLLDYELRRAEAGDPVVFLALGDQPALPLSRLEATDDSALPALVQKLKVEKKVVATEEEAEGESEGEASEEREEDDLGEGDGGLEPSAGAAKEREDGDDRRLAARRRATAWARRAVTVGKLVPKPRSKKAEALRAYDEAVERAAEGLISRVVLPGQWFLVRWGGTRKGSGTFYTRPQLAVPTVRRTLAPLAYDPPRGKEGRPDEEAPLSRWTPKAPEEILRLKVCDPAMGSGSFLVASLRFLTGALFSSLHYHGRLKAKGGETLVTLAAGRPSEGKLSDEILPCRLDDERFDESLRAVLKRHVVERCIYGVDLDPLAVELARVSLWVETMDRTLPFSFLDHKLKVGNSLVGCWFDYFQDYPALAWEREGGDKSHTTGVHFKKEAWTKAIRKLRNEVVKRELTDWLTGQTLLLETVAGRPLEEVHREAVSLFEVLHEMPIHDTEGRATYYKERVLGNPAFNRLREAFDTWCALWFWPADKLDLAPTPRTFEEPPEASRKVVASLCAEHRFFHWELEFPDVFAAEGGGFDALVGNPPWEIQKPNSKEFFSNIDPLYRAYGKQEALGKQRECFAARAGVERAWLEYNARFKALSNWNKNAASPFGGGASGGVKLSLGRGKRDVRGLWEKRRAGRRGFADPEHPFRYQGSADINTYKMFLEQAHALLRGGGLLGLIVPSGVYTDKGSTDLRKLFLTRCRWRWLFGFENREGIFDIHRSFKFGPVIVEKGGATTALRAAFMRRELSDWAGAERHAIAYSSDQVKRFSPKTLAILEIRGRRDLEVLEKIYASSVLLGDDGPQGWGIKYAREFDMTSDSKLFPPRPQWEAKGYRPDEYGRWLLGKWRPRERGSPAPPGRPRWELEAGIILSQDGKQWISEDEVEDVALPLYQGVMIWQFDFAAAAYSPRSSEEGWQPVPWEDKQIIPKYLIRLREVEGARPLALRSRLGFRDVQNATNQRTMIVSLLPGFPCGNTVATLQARASKEHGGLLPALGSFPLDSVLRIKMSQNHVNWFYAEELPVPAALKGEYQRVVVGAVLSLASAGPWFGEQWLTLNLLRCNAPRLPWRRLWAITPHERLRLRCLLDAIVAELYGLDYDDLAWILRDCDHPAERVRDKAFARTLDPKGFWRVDKEKDPELRHTVLTLAAFRDLKETIAANGGNRERGIEAFCGQNGGDGWMLPESLCLAELGLGHDERARRPQPVRSRLGDRFLSWQLEQSVEDSWKECELHARNLLGEKDFARLKAELEGKRTAATQAPPLAAEKPQEKYQPAQSPAQGRLFPDNPPVLDGATEDPPARKKRKQ